MKGKLLELIEIIGKRDDLKDRVVTLTINYNNHIQEFSGEKLRVDLVNTMIGFVNSYDSVSSFNLTIYSTRHLENLERLNPNYKRTAFIFHGDRKDIKYTFTRLSRGLNFNLSEFKLGDYNKSKKVSVDKVDDVIDKMIDLDNLFDRQYKELNFLIKQF